VLDTDIPALEREIAGGTDVFAQYAGRKLGVPSVRSRFCGDIAQRLTDASSDWPAGLDWQACAQPQAATPGMRWAPCHDQEALYLLFACDERDPKKAEAAHVFLMLEPRRLWTCRTYDVSLAGKGVGAWWKQHDYTAQIQNDQTGWRGWIRVPFASLALGADAAVPLYSVGADERSWLTRNPWPGRLRLNNENPADLGWLFLGQSTP
jgi:hypothetical protein